MLAILLFNSGGYRMLTNYLEMEAENNLIAELDQDLYDESTLLHLKVPASLPYGSNTEKYERVNGTIEINGVSYSYVKRRFYKDSLELLCVPNAAKAGIRSARDDFFRLANDFVANSNTKKNNHAHPHTAKFSVQDFTEAHFFSWQFSGGQSVKIQRPLVRSSLGDDFTKLLEHPPKV
jgi:hypothetical protein